MKINLAAPNLSLLDNALQIDLNSCERGVPRSRWRVLVLRSILMHEFAAEA
jgi:hypothetical protein